MHMRLRAVLLGGLLGMVAAPAAAQSLAVSGRISTLGIGAEAGIGAGSMVGLRAGFNVQPFEPSREFDDIDFTLDLASPSYTLLLDLHPGGSGFRLTGGAVFFGSDHELRGVPTEAVDIGDQSYTPEQIGTLSGMFEVKDVAPYLGIGFGRIGGRTGPGFVVDLGVALQGEPGVQLSASGPIASQPVFIANLEEEEREIEDDAKAFRFYPVLSLGFAFGF